MSNLNPHLKSHIVELDGGYKLVHHPLVITTYNDHDFVINDINSMYQRKKEMLKQAKRDHNFFEYVFLHERPYRVRIFHSEVLEWDIYLNKIFGGCLKMFGWTLKISSRIKFFGIVF